MSGVLREILSATWREVELLRDTAPLTRRPHHPIDVRKVMRRPPHAALRLIAEIKHRSPSAGPLSTALSVAERADAYRRGGATMISVLVDREHFDGSFAHIAQARAVVGAEVPILCKGFIVDEVQLDAAESAGADAVLLIVRVLDEQPGALARLISAARARRLVPIVEAVTHDEARRALDAGAEVIGVNARDLDSLAMDAARAAAVLDALPESVVALAFSGISTAAAVAEIAKRSGRRIDGALIGEALMRRDDPMGLLTEMVAAAQAFG
jgi:indole-3-glycerol phosphate synthase